MWSERVLLIGSGGREHAIACKLSQSNYVQQIFVSPGNAGTQCMDTSKVSNVDIPLKNHAQVASWCKKFSINLVVVGPEDPLANGIQDDLAAAGISCFGPSSAAAQMESSKEFAKLFMMRNNIPTARWKSFTNPDEACQHIESAPYKAYVIKLNGLAAGKGVIVANSIEEAKEATMSFFKNASDVKVIVEELLEGPEVSVLCFSDGKTIQVMPPSQDHKRLNDDDKGPNTGGMGAYCPCSWVSDDILQMIKENILQKTITCLNKEDIPYRGVLYAGLMITNEGPKVLEFNCRFGDPETQVILPLLRSDLFSIMKSCVEQKLDSIKVAWADHQSAVAVVLVSSGYPGSYPKGMEISGLSKVEEMKSIHIVHAGTAMSSDDKVVTNGGRVLAVVATSNSLEEAVNLSKQAAKDIVFQGKFHRNDIGIRGLVSENGESLSYASSGVHISTGNDLISKIKCLTDGTSIPGVIGSIGGFGGLFDLKMAGCNSEDTVLVSGTDGVGTKLLLAQQCGLHDTIGIDLVAMCVNDVLSHGSQPLFFLDYFACGRLDLQVARSVVQGIAQGCKLARCALIGGETAEMPGMYPANKYDLAGFCVGAVPRHKLMPYTDSISSNDVIIGIGASGVHSNGFSLIRAVVEKSGFSYGDTIDGQTLGELLLTPTKIYTHLLPLIQKAKAFVHITGGGLLENIPRVLPPGIGAVLDASTWGTPPIFSWLASQGNIKSSEMLRTFNCGVGAAIVVDKNTDVSKWLEDLKQAGENAWNIGYICNIVEGDVPVEVKNLDGKFKNFNFNIRSGVSNSKKRVGVLISGSGTNLQALIDASRKKDSSYEIVLVISNIANVQGLERAEKANIKTKVLSHKDYKSREEYDSHVHLSLITENVEFLCLAGFMRILSASFVNKWKGCVINTHPSLLPSFRGMHAAQQALDAGVTITGCTVHFVSEELDAGAIITQEAVPIFPDDDATTLQERIKQSEHVAFPRALQLLTSNSISLSEDGKIKWLKKQNML